MIWLHSLGKNTPEAQIHKGEGNIISLNKPFTLTQNGILNPFFFNIPLFLFHLFMPFRVYFEAGGKKYILVVLRVTLKDDLQNGERMDLCSFLILVFLPPLLDFEMFESLWTVSGWFDIGSQTCKGEEIYLLCIVLLLLNFKSNGWVIFSRFSIVVHPVKWLKQRVHSFCGLTCPLKAM